MSVTDIRFYHMTRTRLEQALPEIAGKAFERGMRVVVKTGSRERLDQLDSILWTYDPAGFLPHGSVRDGFEKEQPVWLTTDDDNPNDATVLILADGATSEKIDKYTMCCEIFDGNDDETVTATRERWKSYKDAGHELSYFQQDENGKWVKK